MILTMKYFVHYPKIFMAMLVFKHLIPLSIHFVTIGDLTFSKRDFVHSSARGESVYLASVNSNIPILYKLLKSITNNGL